MGTIIGLVCFAGVVVFGALFIVMALKGGSLKIPAIGMGVFFLLVVAVGALTHFGIGPFGNSTADDSEEPTGAVESQDVSESESPEQSELLVEPTDDPEESNGAVKAGSYTLPCGAEVQLFSSVRNDVTGNWRRSTTTGSLVPADYALEYYNAVFSSDNEIHSIWNVSLGTTTCIKTMSGLLFVDTYEYVDGEEHDAKLMFSGMLLDSRIIDKETGAPFDG